MKSLVVVVVAAAVLAARLAHAQPAPSEPAPVPPASAPPAPAPAPAPDVSPDEPGAPPGPLAPAEEPAPEVAGVAAVTPPPQWSEWEVKGRFIASDTPEAVRAVLESEMRLHRALTEAAQSDLAAAVQKYGYELVRFETVALPAGGVRAVLHVEPIPMIRRVDVKITPWWMFSVTLDDELRRRMRLREGGYLPWAAGARQTELDEEAQRIGEYLRDEGFFDASVEIGVDFDEGKAYGLAVRVRIRLGEPYYLDRNEIRITNERDLAISGRTLRDVFPQRNWCEKILGSRCPFPSRFTRAEHQAALQTITSMFRNRGYPSVKVTSDFDPATSFDRRRHAVALTLTIDQRRYIDVVFEGNDKDRVTDEQLRKRLTFTEAASADEFEVEASAAALQAYYQSRGHYDAIVTWSRESFRAFDRIVYRIDERSSRRVSGVRFQVTPSPGRPAAMDDATLRSAVGASKYEDTWFGSAVRPTAASLAEDAERLRHAYRDRGYADARVTVRVAPDPEGLDNAAFSGALLAAERSAKDLHIRFDVVEGPRTVLDQVRITFEGVHRATCAQALGQIGAAIGVTDLASKAIPSDPCIAAAIDVPALSERLEEAGVKLKDWYWNIGRPRAEIQFRVAPGPTRATQTIADYRIREYDEVRVGEVLVRGNFRTRTWVIKEELDFEAGEVVTGEMYERGPRQLRTTNLFNAVNVELVNFEETSDGKVHVVVRVEERHVGRGWVVTELGLSSQKGVFLSAQGVMPNLCLAVWRNDDCGTGTRFSAAGTLGLSPDDGSVAYASIDTSLRFPRWLSRRLVRLAFETEVAGFIRQQDTERFGPLQTIGVSVGATRVWQRLRTEKKPARSIAWTLVRYDFRSRNRDDDAIRPAGADSEESRVPVETRSGAIGTEVIWDQRTDRIGNLSPLVPERGFQLQAGISYAHPALSFNLGQDTFWKTFLSGQYYRTLTHRTLLRLDGRFDYGHPLGQAVLLPEVERFFAGGDTTVRGFEEDRLATEIIQSGLPPFAGVSQLRILPAGGNFRALASIDAQIRVARLPGTSLPLASAVFVDAGLVRNTWEALSYRDIRPSLGLSLVRILTPVGSFAVDYAVPMFPQLGDNPRGRLHISVALRN